MKGHRYEYLLWNDNRQSSVKCMTMPEIKQLTGLSMRDVRRMVHENHGFLGWRVTRNDISQEFDYRAEYQKNKTRKQRYDINGILGFDPDGMSHWYRDVEEAKKSSTIAKRRIMACLREGCTADGWTFDYALKREDDNEEGE